MPDLEPQKQVEPVKGGWKHNLQFYFDVYIRAVHGEPNFLEMEVV